MTKRLVAATFAAALAMTSLGSAEAEPGGCIKYGAAGAVGGHLAGHHAVLGAAGGCVAGMIVRHRYRKQERREAAAWQAEHANDGAAH